MSEFSYILSKHVHEKNVKTYALAQYCDLDRSNMYKIINGKRKPTSIKIVQKICRFMHLTPTEELELTEAYQITLAGYDNYYRRKEVMNFFAEFTLSKASLPSFNYGSDHSINKGETSLLLSSTEVKQALFHIISAEMSHPADGYIRLLIQPDSPFLINLISAESQADMPIRIEHIICLNNNPETTQSHKNYNLNCLKQILPLYGSCRNYECFYYYDDISARTGDLTLFPHMVITSQYVCLLTTSLDRGCVMQSSSSRKMFNNMFTDYQKSSTSLLTQIDNVVEQLNYAESLIRECGTNFCFQLTPCFTPFITLLMAKKYISIKEPERSMFITRFFEYIKEMSNWYKQGNITCIFSYEGVERFLETGRISEYPHDVYIPFDKSDKSYLVKNLIQACKNTHYHMLRESIINPEHELYLFVNQQNGYLMFSSPYNKQPVYLHIEEPGLLFTFYDFFENLDNDMFYTPDETETLLNHLINTII